MEEMKHQDGYAPSESDTKKLNEFMSWLASNGYKGIVLIHKDDVGVSWVSENSIDDVRHHIINALGHIMRESEDVARMLLHGMDAALEQIKNA
jgi:hypothetical protein